ncbi:MAG: hypothetical protein MSA89_10565 [Clostridium sp.]|nr:hypothetical protein [Clostridium sp.]MCI7443508.1 hypothetical protein [Clostridium sp.]
MELYIFLVLVVYFNIIAFINYQVKKRKKYECKDIRKISNEEYIILKHNSKEKNSDFIKYYGYKLYVYQYITSVEGRLGIFLSNKNVNFYSLNKAEKLIYNFFNGEAKRLRFANGDKNINMAITQQRLSIKRNLLDEGLIKDKLFDFEILFGYVFRVLSMFTITTLFLYLAVLSPEFQPEIKDIIVYAFTGLNQATIMYIMFIFIAISSYKPEYVTLSGKCHMMEFEKDNPENTDTFSEEVIFQEPEKNLKRYLINKTDFLKILGLGRW